MIHRLRSALIVAVATIIVWWWAASSLVGLVPGLVAVAVLVGLMLDDLGWARDPLWRDEAGLEREMMRARLAERERLCGPREEE